MATNASTPKAPLSKYLQEEENTCMKLLNIDLNDDDDDDADTLKDRKRSVDTCIYKLKHAHACKSASCGYCHQEMKIVVTHTKYCKRKSNGSCPVCKKLAALCCYHEKHCEGTFCYVPSCSNFQSAQYRIAGLRRNGMNGSTSQVEEEQSAQQSSNVNMSAGVTMKPELGFINLPPPY